MNCVWGEWKRGCCSKSCGNGVRQDVRIKMVVEANGGTCYGDPSRDMNCLLEKCQRKI